MKYYNYKCSTFYIEILSYSSLEKYVPERNTEAFRVEALHSFDINFLPDQKNRFILGELNFLGPGIHTEIAVYNIRHAS
jgi:hypothetical protein